MRPTHFLFGLIFSAAACNSPENKNTENSAGMDHNMHNSALKEAQSNASENPMSKMHDAMDKSMQEMHAMKPTGDADYDFATMMKMHHQGAISMAEIETASGQDPQMKQMAQKMIDAQKKENEKFDLFLQSAAKGGYSDFGKKAMSMMTPMSEMSMEGSSLDAMFASMMIPHHNDAVRMAKEYLQSGTSEELKSIARNIIETQPKEVEELKSWLAKQK